MIQQFIRIILTTLLISRIASKYHHTSFLETHKVREDMEHFGGSSAEPSKGFLFGEIGCKRTRHKVVCCDFSSDGKLLACCGHSKKVDFWNLDTLQTESTPDEHRLLITDVRFRPNSSQLATASLDGSIRLWDASHPVSA